MSTTPQSDPQAMPLADLKQAAGLNDPPASPAAPAEQTLAEPVAPQPVVPERFTVTQDDNGVVIQMAPEFGGEVYKGKDWQEAALKAINSKADANIYIKQLKSQPIQAVQTQPAQQPPPEPIDPQQEATDQWLEDRVDSRKAKKMGLSLEEYRYRQQIAFQTAPETYQEREAARFRQMCPDFVDTPQNLKALDEVFAGQPFPSAEQIKYAWAVLKYEGKVHGMQPVPETTPSPRPPVMPTAGATPVSNADQNAWTMDMNALKKAAGLG